MQGSVLLHLIIFLERAAWYGMRAGFVIYLIQAFNLETPVILALYGAFSLTSSFFQVTGGWIADRVTGWSRGVLIGGIALCAGYFLLLGEQASFLWGLGILVAGRSLVSPAITALLGDTLPGKGVPKGVGFSFWYLAINLGAMLGSLMLGISGETAGFTWAFATAGILTLIASGLALNGWLTGLFQVTSSQTEPEQPAAQNHPGLAFGGGATYLLLIASFSYFVLNYALEVGDISEWFGFISLPTLVISFILAWIFTREERPVRHLTLILIPVVMLIFWGGYEVASGISHGINTEIMQDLEIDTFLYKYLPIFLQMPALFLGLILTIVWASKSSKEPLNLISWAMPLGVGILLVGFLLAATITYFIPPGTGWLILIIALAFLEGSAEAFTTVFALVGITFSAPKSIRATAFGNYFGLVSLSSGLAGVFAYRLQDQVFEAATGAYLNASYIIGIGLVITIGMALLIRFLPGGEQN